MMDVDANWTGEDEPALWEDWEDEFKSPAIPGVQEMDVPDGLFDEWDPEIENESANEAGYNQACVSVPVLSKDPEYGGDAENDFSEGIYFSAGRIGGSLEERDDGNNTAEGRVKGLAKINEVRFEKGFSEFSHSCFGDIVKNVKGDFHYDDDT